MENWREFCTLVTPKVQANRCVEGRLGNQPHSGFRPISFPPCNLPLRKVHPITLPIQQPPASPAYMSLDEDTVIRLDTAEETREYECCVGYDLSRFLAKQQAAEFICVFCRLVCSADFQACSLCGAKYCRECILASSKLRFSQLCPECSASCPLTASVSQALMPVIQKLAERHSGLVLRCKFSDMGCGVAVPVREIAAHERCCRFRQTQRFPPNPTKRNEQKRVSFKGIDCWAGDWNEGSDE